MKHRITQVRRAKGVSQGELADRVGSTQSMIGKLERGERKLTMQWLSRIASALQVPTAELLDLTDVPVNIGTVDTDGRVREDPKPSWYDDVEAELPVWSLSHQQISDYRAAMLGADASIAIPGGSHLIFRTPGKAPEASTFGRLVAAWVVADPSAGPQAYEMTIGVLMPGSTDDRYHLISLNGAPRQNLLVKFVALIERIELA